MTTFENDVTNEKESDVTENVTTVTIFTENLLRNILSSGKKAWKLIATTFENNVAENKNSDVAGIATTVAIVFLQHTSTLLISLRNDFFRRSSIYSPSRRNKGF